MFFQLVYLYLTTLSLSKCQRYGVAHFDCKYLGNGCWSGKHYTTAIKQEVIHLLATGIFTFDIGLPFQSSRSRSCIFWLRICWELQHVAFRRMSAFTLTFIACIACVIYFSNCSIRWTIHYFWRYRLMYNTVTKYTFWCHNYESMTSLSCFPSSYQWRNNKLESTHLK